MALAFTVRHALGCDRPHGSGGRTGIGAEVTVSLADPLVEPEMAQEP